MNSLLVCFACTFFMRCSSFVLYTQTGASPILVKEALANSASTSHTSSTRTDTFLFATPPKRIPRRNLKKRTRRKRDGKSTISQASLASDSNVNIETRPLVRSKSIEAGEDYWIDEEELKKFSEKEKAIKNRKAMEGEMSKEKLQQEVVAPYKQNWIGLFSVGIVILAVIVQEFPELLREPTIPLPDL